MLGRLLGFDCLPRAENTMTTRAPLILRTITLNSNDCDEHFIGGNDLNDGELQQLQQDSSLKPMQSKSKRSENKEKKGQFKININEFMKFMLIL